MVMVAGGGRPREGPEREARESEGDRRRARVASPCSRQNVLSESHVPAKDEDQFT